MNKDRALSIPDLLVARLPVVVAAVCLAPASAMTAGITDSFWINPRGGMFHEAANWDGAVPTEDVVAIFDLDGAYIVDFDADALSDRVILRQGDVTFDLGAQVYGALNELNSSPSLTIADVSDGSADLTLNAGLFDAQFANIGEAVASAGSLTLTGGAALTSASHVHVGYGGFGSLDVGAGSSVLCNVGVVGAQPISSGIAVVGGELAEWTTVSSLTVGQEGSGELHVLDGASVSSPIGIIGQQLGSSGDVTVSGVGSSLFVDGPLDIGQAGDGALNIIDGGLVIGTSFATIGTFPEDFNQVPEFGGIGHVLVSGAGSSLITDGELHVGFQFAGSLRIEDGGFVSTPAAFLNTFGLEYASGEAIVTGKGSSWSITGALAVEGPLEVSNGGHIVAFDTLVGPLGALRGDATIESPLTIEGSVEPGALADARADMVAGTLTVDGSVTMVDDAAISLEVVFDDEANEWRSDRLDVTGALTLAGDMVLTSNGSPLVGTTFTLLSATNISESFDAITATELCCDRAWEFTFTDTDLTVTVTGPITGDLDDDGDVDGVDLVILLGMWGACDDCGNCAADLDGDCDVDGIDLVILLGSWTG